MTISEILLKPVIAFIMIPIAWGADQQAKGEHDAIGVSESTQTSNHTLHPDAQWFPDAGFGLFLHQGLSTVKPLRDVSWPMIPGRILSKKRIEDPVERDRIIREGDWNLDGKTNITPNEYWAMAKDFHPQKYDPDKWLVAAKAAGFTYAVLITRHHEGFSFWPSDADDFNTKTFMNGQDLVRPFVEACRKHGLKVGLYYSPPNWHFNRDYENFLYNGTSGKNPEFPALDADLKPRTGKPDPAVLATQRKAYAQHIRDQVEELLTRYGTIDLLWFDGRGPEVDGKPAISMERIRALQPGIVVNPRLHGTGDFVTFENVLGNSKPITGWGEFCHTWAPSWTYYDKPYRSNAFILGELVRSRSLGVNYLLGTGPDRNGELHPAAYDNMAIVATWMPRHGEAIYHVRPLPIGETSSVPATANGSTRYLYRIGEFNPKAHWFGPYDSDLLPAKDLTFTYQGKAVMRATLLGDGKDLEVTRSGNVTSISLPTNRQNALVDVVKLELSL